MKSLIRMQKNQYQKMNSRNPAFLLAYFCKMLCYNGKNGGYTMNQFNFHIPTQIKFGEGAMDHIPSLLSVYGKNVLLVYGGGSIKKNGIYDEVIDLLSSFHVVELGGVNPNPRIESVREGAKLCREHNIDVILSVGGGSCIDCSKAISAAAYYEGDAWDLVLDATKITKALPIVTVLTLSATGSEMNNSGVITNFATNEKLGFGNPLLYPKASILDPCNTFTVPKNQTAAGCADILSHLFEQYFNVTQGAMVQEELAHGLMRTAIHYGPIALQNPNDYEARANLMWAATLSLNGLVGAGFGKSWSCHPMEHVLSAYYDITHGTGLAILTPKWMRYIQDDMTRSRFVLYGTSVWGINPTLPEKDIVEQAIQATEHFLYDELGLPSTLREVGIDDRKLEEMAQAAVDSKGGKIKGFKLLEKEDVYNIYKMCL